MSGFAEKTVSDELLGRAKRGDEAACAELFEIFGPPVYSLAARLTGSRSIADDVLQDTFIEILRGLPGFRGEAALATWIRRIAVSRSLMVLRSAWRRRATLFRDLGGEDSSAWEPADPVNRDAGLSADLERALARLPDVSRIVVLLHDVEGYTHTEIAGLMGRTPSFSKSQLARAHARLRGLLEQGDELPARVSTRGD